MPRAADPSLFGGLSIPMDRDPTARIGYQHAKPEFDLEAIFAQLRQFAEDFLFPVIEELTGVDLTVLLPLLDGFTAFVDSITDVLSGDPAAFLGALSDILGGDPTAFFTSLFGIFGGAAGLGQAGTFFTSLLSLLGNPTGLTSGTVDPTAWATDFITDILNPTGLLASINGIVEAITGLLGGGDLGDLTSWFTDLLGLLGDPTGLGSGTPALPSISSIPILGGLLSGGNILAAIIPGLDASKITSGTFAQSMITNLTTMLGGFGSGSSILSQLIGAIPHGGSPTGITGFGNIFTDFFGLFGSLSGIGTGSPVPDTSGRPRIFGGILDGLFGGFTQIFDIPADQDAVADAAGGVNSAITGAQAGLSQLQAALSPGNPDSDDFERSNSGNWDTSQWLLYGDGAGGTPSVDGHNAVWESPYTVDSEMVGRRITKIATTDNQAVEVVLASAIGFITDGNAALDLWLRMTTFTSYATRTGLRFRFWGNKSWQLHWFSSGTPTLLTSGAHSKSVSSGTFRFEAGQSLTTRRFVAKINSEPIMDFTEAGTTSQVGAAYRSRGVGLRGEFSLIGLAFLPAIEVQPCKLKQWSAAG